MTRWRTGTLVAMTIGAACNPLAPDIDGDYSLSLSVNVSGDPQLGPPAYKVTIDSAKWRDLLPNEHTVAYLTPGSHVVAFSGPEPEPVFIQGSPVLQNPVWCTAQSDKLQLVETNGKTGRIDYDVSCPPLTGTGTLKITVSVSHKNPIPDLMMKATRVIGASYSEQRTTSPGVLTLTVPVGIYSFTLSGPNCFRTFDDIAFGYRQAVVRDGAVGATILYITCP